MVVTQLGLILASLCGLLFAASLSTGQQPRPNITKDCGHSANGLLKRNGKVIWFSPKQMNALAINRARPVFPPMCHCQGTAIVAVVVNSNGVVECAQNISGHDLLEAAAINAAMKWTFEPLTKRGDKFSFAGLLAFTFHSSGAVTIDVHNNSLNRSANSKLRISRLSC